MLIDERRRSLDYQFILWRFETTDLHEDDDLRFLDNGPGGMTESQLEEMPEVDSDGNEKPRKTAEEIKGSSCCTIF